MSIRTRIFGPGADDPLLRSKRPKGARADTLDSVAVCREEVRRGNARGGDRHRLNAEQALLRTAKNEYAVELVNLSAGGAMIKGQVDLVLWDRVGLSLGDDGELECAVRWIKGDSAGLEFAHETRIECGNEQRDQLLRAVIRKSFPDTDFGPLEPKRAEAAPASDFREAPRHPLIWNGIVYCDYDVEPVRLRNISNTGALVQSSHPLPVGETVYLQLGAAGRFEAMVRWTRGTQSGLAFAEPFDLHALAKVDPEVAADSNPAPEAFGQQAPWAPGWRRSTVQQMAQRLGC